MGTDPFFLDLLFILLCDHFPDLDPHFVTRSDHGPKFFIRSGSRYYLYI